MIQVEKSYSPDFNIMNVSPSNYVQPTCRISKISNTKTERNGQLYECSSNDSSLTMSHCAQCDVRFKVFTFITVSFMNIPGTTI